MEQVCEALQVSVTLVGSQRVKNNLSDFGAGAGLTLLLLAGWWDKISYPCLIQQLPCQLLGTLYQGCKGHRGSPQPGREVSSHCPEWGWPELPSARALPSSA